MDLTALTAGPLQCGHRPDHRVAQAPGPGALPAQAICYADLLTRAVPQAGLSPGPGPPQIVTTLVGPSPAVPFFDLQAARISEVALPDVGETESETGADLAPDNPPAPVPHQVTPAPVMMAAYWRAEPESAVMRNDASITEPARSESMPGETDARILRADRSDASIRPQAQSTEYRSPPVAEFPVAEFMTAPPEAAPPSPTSPQSAIEHSIRQEYRGVAFPLESTQSTTEPLPSTGEQIAGIQAEGPAAVRHQIQTAPVELPSPGMNPTSDSLAAASRVEPPAQGSRPASRPSPAVPRSAEQSEATAEAGSAPAASQGFDPGLPEHNRPAPAAASLTLPLPTDGHAKSASEQPQRVVTAPRQPQPTLPISIASPETGTPAATGPDGTQGEPSVYRTTPAPPFFRNVLELSTPAAASFTGREPEVDPAQVVERVSQSVREVHQNGRQLTIRLTPPELGALQIDVTTRNGALTARLETETEAARQIILEHLPQLRESLQQIGATMERIDVQIGQHSREGQSGWSQQSRGDQHQGERGRSEARPQQPELASETSEPATRGRQPRVRPLDHLNIQV